TAGEANMRKMKSACNGNPIAFRKLRYGALAVAYCVVIGAGAMPTHAGAQAPAKGGIPDLASSSFAWLAFGAEWRDPPPGLRGPVKKDPDHPYHGNHETTGKVTLRFGHYQDPGPKPWAAAQMRPSHQDGTSRKPSVPVTAQT